MPWVYEITDIQTVTASGATYVLVDFWRTRGASQRGDPPHITEEFIMSLRTTYEPVVTDDRGFSLRESGVYASPNAPPDESDPPVTETVPADVVGEMEGNIERFISSAKAKGIPDVDMSDPNLGKSNADPRGILARSDVQAAKGRKREFTP